MKCKYCGTPIKPQAKLCPSCFVALVSYFGSQSTARIWAEIEPNPPKGYNKRKEV